MMVFSKTLVCTKVIPNNGCRQKLLKSTEHKLAVYVDVYNIQKSAT